MTTIFTAFGPLGRGVFRAPAAGAILLWALAGCGGGGASPSDASNSQPQSLVPVTALGCAADVSIDSPMGRLHNNTWNLQAVGTRPWQQCLQQRSGSGGAEFGWSWDWPVDMNGVLAYPTLIKGAKPWDSDASNDARLPRALVDVRRLLLDLDVQTDSSGVFNQSVSMWLIDTPTLPNPPDEQVIKAEVLVITQTRGTDWTAGQAPTAEVTVGDTSWLVYVQPQWSDASGGSAQRWTLVTYLAKNAPTAPFGARQIDLRRLLEDAVSRGAIPASLVLADVELGNEVAGGKGSTWVKRFDLTLD